MAHLKRFFVLTAVVALAGLFMTTTGNGPASVAFERASAVTPDHGPGVPDPRRTDPSELTDPRNIAGRDIDELRGTERILVNGRGLGKDTDPDPMKFSVTVPLYAYESAEEIGSVTHNFQCANPSCTILDDIDVYRLGDGDITAPGRVTAIHDPEHPGFLLTAARTAGDNITAATGRYEGRTGRVQVYGYVDARGFPNQFVLDEVYLFELN